MIGRWVNRHISAVIYGLVGLILALTLPWGYAALSQHHWGDSVLFAFSAAGGLVLGIIHFTQRRTR